MNKTAIKNFAVRARRKLIEEVTQKAYEIGITKEKPTGIEIITFEGGFRIKGRENGRTFKGYELKQRDKLIETIKAKGFQQVIEEVAYTWFNRFIALRFMEVNYYLPTGVRVLSSSEEGKAEPDIIKEALAVDLEVDKDIVYRLQDSGDIDDLYKYLLIKQCNQLGKIMPSVFEEIADYTELLLPNKLLAEGSIIKDLVNSINEYDWKIELNEEEQKLEGEKGEHGIEIIGWLYQYYISEKKDEVFAGLKENKKITKENIPAATQLFTPKWIVKYMVENSLGRLWLESHPNEELKAMWKYYLEEAEQEPEVRKQLDELKNPNLSPEEITILDPAMGSGHILVYAFDVLYEIYLSAGYSERDIPTLILEKNLYGLDIDDRAGQLASFALLMKARSKNRRIFRNKLKLNLCSIQESNGVSKEAIDYYCSGESVVNNKEFRNDVEYLVKVFHDAKEYGSILDVKEIDFGALESRIDEIRNHGPTDIFALQYREVITEKALPLVKQAKIMSQKYDVVCTNPPYMGRKGMNNKLIEFIDEYYTKEKYDLFAVFIEKGFQFLKQNGLNAMVTMQSWMFLSGFEEMRKKIVQEKFIVTLVHMENMVMGIAFGTSATVFKNTKANNYKGIYMLVSLKDINIKNNAPYKFPILNSRYNSTTTKDFMAIPGTPIAYWVSGNIVTSFQYENIGNKLITREGMATADNDRFLRYWHEADINNIGFHMCNSDAARKSGLRWFPYNKGGEFRKWYGNNRYIVDWENDGYRIRNNKDIKTGRIRSHNYNGEYGFKKGITWSALSSGNISIRYTEEGSLFDSKGAMGFAKKNDSSLYYILGLLNSKVATQYLSFLSPTMDFKVGDIIQIPFILSDNYKTLINKLVSESITISKIDWDLYENSWNFKNHLLLLHNNETQLIAQAFNRWSNYSNTQYVRLKSNEVELNTIFIKIYGLQDELTPEVDDKDITISKADRERDIKSFISYAVGCMFGRYSLDEEGLIFAGGEFIDRFKDDNGQWLINTEKGWIKSSLDIANDNIISIADGDYFEDDILQRFIQFVKVSFGQESLEENLDFIAETLGKKANETSRQTIRRYFLKDFYKDHVQTYKKRPIYWLFDSGKENGFKALIYMHRYDPLTVARVRTDYLHKLQKKYEAELNHLNLIINSNISDREKAVARKKKEVVLKQIAECKSYDQAIAHVANQKIAIDLDDGVVVNYAKFQGVEIPQGEGKKPLKADLLAKI